MSKPMSEQMQKLAARYEKATGKKFNAKTNAQKIRAMSDEELADFLLKTMSDVQCFAEGILPYHSCPQNHNCKQCGIDWLHQPAEEDKHD